ncbi:MAG: hypothetical protein GY793_04125 [Proteobacteria bacterium]|nr:hypothetical protein [Pseudomonadota bacterium]
MKRIIALMIAFTLTAITFPLSVVAAETSKTLILERCYNEKTGQWVISEDLPRPKPSKTINPHMGIIQSPQTGFWVLSIFVGCESEYNMYSWFTWEAFEGYEAVKAEVLKYFSHEDPYFCVTLKDGLPFEVTFMKEGAENDWSFRNAQRDAIEMVEGKEIDFPTCPE